MENYDFEEIENEMIIGSLNRLVKERFDRYKRSEKIIDLHSHSVYSDGEKTPNELLNLAIDKNIGVYAITDHDNLDGIKFLRENYSDLISESGIKVVNGIELSAQVDKGTMHILGYDFDIYNKELNDRLKELKNNSMYSMISYFNDLKNTYGIRFSNEEILEILNSKGNIGRPHLAKLLIKHGYVKSVQEAFDLYLHDMYERVRKLNKKITYEECIELIKNAGGYAILAHPYQLKQTNEELEETIKNMISCGLDGIELYHSNHTKEQIKFYKQLIEKYNLLYSVGSDYHGPHVKPSIELGSGINGNLNKKEATLLRKIK